MKVGSPGLAVILYTEDTDEFKDRIAQLMGNFEGLDEKDQFKVQKEAFEEILPEAFVASALAQQSIKQKVMKVV